VRAEASDTSSVWGIHHRCDGESSRSGFPEFEARHCPWSGITGMSECTQAQQSRTPKTLHLQPHPVVAPQQLPSKNGAFPAPHALRASAAVSRRHRVATQCFLPQRERCWHSRPLRAERTAVTTDRVRDRQHWFLRQQRTVHLEANHRRTGLRCETGETEEARLDLMGSGPARSPTSDGPSVMSM
jgi:hypothetical protein